MFGLNVNLSQIGLPETVILRGGAEVPAQTLFIETCTPPKEARGVLLAELRRDVTQRVGAPDSSDFAILLDDPTSGDLIGGLWAISRWGGFLIDILIVPETLRRQGLGSRLIRAAEAEARRRGCDHMWLETYNFQSRPFYERFGFEVFGQLDGPAPIYPMFFMKKDLK
ncbi:GNAT family N-acetyltransferase [Sinorhizobium meliloti]|nr:GNAT family N-acetyltransferase [Sinorhizobium meliloti]